MSHYNITAQLHEQKSKKLLLFYVLVIMILS